MNKSWWTPNPKDGGLFGKKENSVYSRWKVIKTSTMIAQHAQQLVKNSISTLKYFNSPLCKCILLLIFIIYSITQQNLLFLAFLHIFLRCHYHQLMYGNV